MSKQLHIVHLYPNEMNTYGDRGNIITLMRRAEWGGLEPILHFHHPGQKFPDQADLLFGGGGQDSAQSNIQRDILAIGPRLQELASAGVPMLMICGMYQLFGHRFITHEKTAIQGISIFGLETRATKHRLIGNLAVETKEFGTLYGFENHSGQTYLNASQAPLGKTIRGNGNNDHDGHEGARIHNIVGTYMHGPVLPLNPQLADWLISTAAHRLNISYKPTTNKELSSLIIAARANAKTRNY